MTNDRFHSLEGAQEALLLYSFGPVQPFIAAGRRAVDLWAGSMLLAKLAEAAVGLVEEAHGREAVLFPALPDSDVSTETKDAATYPNRFLARVPADAVQDLVADVTKRLRDTLIDYAESGLKAIGAPESAASAAADALDTHWVAVPADGPGRTDLLGRLGRDDNSYGALYAAIEALLGGRKALRTPRVGVESGYRASLTADLPAYLPDGVEAPSRVKEQWDIYAARSKKRIGEGERLSVIGLAKRSLAWQRDKEGERLGGAFPSTSSFAASDFVWAVQQAMAKHEGVRAAVREYEQGAHDLFRLIGHRYREEAIPRLASEHGLFHELSGRLLIGDDLDRETVLRDLGHDPGRKEDLPAEWSQLESRLARLAERRAELFGQAKALGIRPPSRYYGVLLLDGDRMGDWLAGGRDFHPDDPRHQREGPERHREISKALGVFARKKVPRIINTDHVGRLVYSGGDDVLAFLSFEEALKASQAVRAAFSSTDVLGYEPRASGDLWDDATASAGLVLAHHLTPLQQVLAAARTAEKAAKRAGRDRLAITAQARSGAPVTAVVPWSLLGSIQDFAHALRGTSKYVARLSKSYVVDLRELADRLSDPRGGHVPALDSAFEAEARRLLARRVEVSGDDDDSRQHAAHAFFGAAIAPLWAVAQDDWHRHVSKRAAENRRPDAEQRPARALVRRLYVAQFLGRGGDR